MQEGSLIETICNICMALGGLGTLGTLIYMIVDSKKKSKQIDTVQMIQSHQLESLYEPDLRLVSWSFKNVGNFPNEVILLNHGEDIRILGIHDSPESCVLNKEGVKGWFPYNLDKDSDIHIPLSAQILDLRGCYQLSIRCSNRLGLTYMVPILIADGKPVIQRPIIQE